MIQNSIVKYPEINIDLMPSNVFSLLPDDQQARFLIPARCLHSWLRGASATTHDTGVSPRYAARMAWKCDICISCIAVLMLTYVGMSLTELVSTL